MSGYPCGEEVGNVDDLIVGRRALRRGETQAYFFQGGCKAYVIGAAGLAGGAWDATCAGVALNVVDCWGIA